MKSNLSSRYRRFIEFTNLELKVIQYALDWIAHDTIRADHQDHPIEYQHFFDREDPKNVMDTLEELKVKLQESPLYKTR